MKNFILNQIYNYKSLKSIKIRYIKIIMKKQWFIIWNENIKTANILWHIMKEKHMKTDSALYNEIEE